MSLRKTQSDFLLQLHEYEKADEKITTQFKKEFPELFNSSSEDKDEQSEEDEGQQGERLEDASDIKPGDKLKVPEKPNRWSSGAGGKSPMHIPESDFPKEITVSDVVKQENGRIAIKDKEGYGWDAEELVKIEAEKLPTEEGQDGGQDGDGQQGDGQDGDCQQGDGQDGGQGDGQDGKAGGKPTQDTGEQKDKEYEQGTEKSGPTENPEEKFFQKGAWYTSTNPGDKYFIRLTSVPENVVIGQDKVSVVGYGFETSGSWFDHRESGKQTGTASLRPATAEEVHHRFTKEAEKRGLVPGAMVKDLFTRKTKTLEAPGYSTTRFNAEDDTFVYSSDDSSGIAMVYRKGKWATPIK